MVAADLVANFAAVSLSPRCSCLSPFGLWRDDAPIPLMEMVAGPLEDLPKYKFAHPESAAAQAAMAPPAADPALIPAVIAQQAWNVGCTTKFAWPIADHGLYRPGCTGSPCPTLVTWGRQDALVSAAYAADFGS